MKTISSISKGILYIKVGDNFKSLLVKSIEKRFFGKYIVTFSNGQIGIIQNPDIVMLADINGKFLYEVNKKLSGT